jgi:2-C-methyl-D-erythritol 4-phosphate cytidylyltransferase
MNTLPPPADVSVLVPAAGKGERLGRGPKAQLQLAGRPVIDWVADKAKQLGAEVIVACTHGQPAPAGTLRVEGGATRQESVLRLAQAATRPWCVLWDAASPFGSVAHAREVLASAQETGAATSCCPAEVPWLELQEGRVLHAHAARGTASSRTPQAYATALLREVAQRGAREGWIVQSTVELFLRAGVQVRAVRGDKLNLKLTTAEDLVLAQALLQRLSS